MRTILVIIFFIFLPNLAFAAIKVKCNYSYFPSAELLKHLKNDESEIAKSLKQSLGAKPLWNNITFIVDGKTIKEVELHSMASETPIFKYSLKIHLEYILIKEYFFNADNASYTLSDEYYINRVNGKLSGTKFAAHNYFLPYFKKDDYMWMITGKCSSKKIEKIF